MCVVLYRLPWDVHIFGIWRISEVQRPAVHLDEQLTVTAFLNSFRKSPCENNFFDEKKQEFGKANLPQRFNNNEPGEVYLSRSLHSQWTWWKSTFSESVSDRFRLDAVYFLLALCTTTHHRVQLALRIYQGGNPFTLVETGIYDQYTRVDVRFSNRYQLQFLNSGQIPILWTQLTLSYCLLVPKS